MTFTIVVPVCSLTIATAQDCSIDTAIAVMHGPHVPNPLLCSLHGQAYIAESAIGRGLRPGQFVKLLCLRPSNRLLRAERRASLNRGVAVSTDQ